VKFSVYKDLLKRYHAGESTKVERQLVDIWYDSFEEERAVAEVRPGEEEKLRVKERLRKHIDANKQEEPKLKRNKQKRLAPWLRVAAAVIMLILGITWFKPTDFGLPSRKYRTKEPIVMHFSTNSGEYKTVKLSDGSVVTLNANSSLVLKDGYGEKQRFVQLRGEAFFEIRPLADRPFWVQTDELFIQVLGTSFNVKAYDYRPKAEITVGTGRVQVSSENKGQSLLLHRGDGYIYDRANKQFRKKAVPATLAWRGGSISLAQVSFSELALCFRDVYGISLISTDATVLNHRYTLKLKYERSASQTLEIICHMLNKQYRKEANGSLNIF
jgi:ferric-dicitrate binding protein FerR (iron transport regulator)